VDYIPDNGICERFHKSVLNEFYRVAFRKKVYRSIDELQADLDVWIHEYNEARPHQDAGASARRPTLKPSSGGSAALPRDRKWAGNSPSAHRTRSSKILERILEIGGRWSKFAHYAIR
jgi:hypothetical protein